MAFRIPGRDAEPAQAGRLGPVGLGCLRSLPREFLHDIARGQGSGFAVALDAGGAGFAERFPDCREPLRVEYHAYRRDAVRGHVVKLAHLRAFLIFKVAEHGEPARPAFQAAVPGENRSARAGIAEGHHALTEHDGLFRVRQTLDVHEFAVPAAAYAGRGRVDHDTEIVTVRGNACGRAVGALFLIRGEAHEDLLMAAQRLAVKAGDGADRTRAHAAVRIAEGLSAHHDGAFLWPAGLFVQDRDALVAEHPHGERRVPGNVTVKTRAAVSGSAAG